MWGEYILANNKTTNLGIKLIQPTDKFIEVTFNNVIKDIDDKCLGVDHAKSPAHFSVWNKNTDYVKGDIIRITKGKSNQYYQCIVGGTSGVTEPENNVTGSIVTDGSIKWKVYEFGAGSSNSLDLWTGGTYYTRGQIVLYNDEIFRCKIDHTSLNTFAQDKINFQQLFSNVQEWKDGVLYQENATVVYNNRIYKCITEHTSTTTFDKTKFELLDIYGLVDEYAKNTEYQKGQIVTYQGTYYVANANFTSGNTNFIDDIANFNLLYASVNDWTYPKYYQLSTVVIKDGLLYKCVSSHTSTSNFETDRVKWKLLGNVPAYLNNWQSSTYYYTGQCVLVDSIIYRSKADPMSDATSFDNETNSWEIVGGVGGANEWQVNKPYQVGQFVIYKDILYRCNAKHTSNTTDFQTDISKWDIVYANIPNWASGVYYKTGTIIKYDNLFFINSAGHTSSSNFETDRSKWTLLSNVLANLQAWVANKYYYEGQCIVNGNTVYRCKTTHTSVTDWDNDNADWETIGGGTLNTWTAATMYLKDDIVIHNNKLYQCLLAHKANNDFNHDYKNDYWQEISKTQIDDWTSSTHYYIGDLVLKDAQIYKCIKNNDSSTDFKVDYETDGEWELLSPTVDEITDWTANKEYKKYQLVLHNNLLYRCKVLHTSTPDFDTDYNNDDWTQLCSTTILDWATPHKYEIGGTVCYDTNLYRCIKEHTSANTFKDDIDNWELLSNIQDWESNKTYIQGNIVLYDNTPYKVTKNHVSNDFSLDKDNFEITYSNIRDFNASSYYKAGSYVLYDNNIYKALNDTKGDIGHKLQLQTSASFTDSEGVYTKEIGTDSGGYDLVTEPTGNYINTVIDLGSICDVTQVILSELILVNCAPGEIIVETSKDGTEYTEADSLSTGGYSGFKDGTTLNINKKVRYIKLVFKSVYKSNGNIFTFNKVEVYVSNPDWHKITNTQKPSIEPWRTGTEYNKNEIVVYNEKIYKCAVDHTSGSDFSVDKPKYWESLSDNPIINDWISGNNYEVGTCVIKSNQNGIVDWTSSKQYNVNDEAVYDGYIYTCKTQNTDAEFTETNWEVKEPVYNRIYRCIKNTTSKDFNESEWQLINGDSKATADEVDELLA